MHQTFGRSGVLLLCFSVRCYATVNSEIRLQPGFRSLTKCQWFCVGGWDEPASDSYSVVENSPCTGITTPADKGCFCSTGQQATLQKNLRSCMVEHRSCSETSDLEVEYNGAIEFFNGYCGWNLAVAAASTNAPVPAPASAPLQAPAPSQALSPLEPTPTTSPSFTRSLSLSSQSSSSDTTSQPTDPPNTEASTDGSRISPTSSTPQSVPTPTTSTSNTVSTPSSSSLPETGGTGGLSREAQIATATTLGVGIPALILAAVGVWYNRKASRRHEQQFKMDNLGRLHRQRQPTMI